MILTFYLTFAGLGPWLGCIMSLGIKWWTDRLENLLSWFNVAMPLKSLIIDGICAGVGSVLSFIPTIGVLFFCLGILEESGYLQIVAHVMDRPLAKVGIPGQSFVPMLMGFGCSVPAILAAGKIENRRQKLLTLSLIPFMSCSAKLPVYAMIIPVFFPESPGAVTFSLYIMGIILAILLAIVYNKAVPQDTHTGNNKILLSFKPSFKFPRLKTVVSYTWENVKGFVKKAFTVIFIASVVIWFAENFTADLRWVSDPDSSILASAGKLIAPVFAPLGFGHWHAAAALMAGLSAKEALVSTLAILSGAGGRPEGGLEGGAGGGFEGTPGGSSQSGDSGYFGRGLEGGAGGGSQNGDSGYFGRGLEGTPGGGGSELTALLMEMFTPLSAFSFMVFCLLYAPCVASLASIRRESGSYRYAAGLFIFQTVVAYLTAFIIYNTGKIFF